MYGLTKDVSTKKGLRTRQYACDFNGVKELVKEADGTGNIPNTKGSSKSP